MMSFCPVTIKDRSAMSLAAMRASTVVPKL